MEFSDEEKMLGKILSKELAKDAMEKGIADSASSFTVDSTLSRDTEVGRIEDSEKIEALRKMNELDQNGTAKTSSIEDAYESRFNKHYAEMNAVLSEIEGANKKLNELKEKGNSAEIEIEVCRKNMEILWKKYHEIVDQFERNFEAYEARNERKTEGDFRNSKIDQETITAKGKTGLQILKGGLINLISGQANNKESKEAETSDNEGPNIEKVLKKINNHIRGKEQVSVEAILAKRAVETLQELDEIMNDLEIRYESLKLLEEKEEFEAIELQKEFIEEGEKILQNLLAKFRSILLKLQDRKLSQIKLKNEK